MFQRRRSGEDDDSQSSRSPQQSPPLSPALAPHVQSFEAAAAAILDEMEQQRKPDLRDRFSDSDVPRNKRKTRRHSNPEHLLNLSANLPKIPAYLPASTTLRRGSGSAANTSVPSAPDAKFFVPGMSSRSPTTSERNLNRWKTFGSFGSLRSLSSQKLIAEKKKARELAQLRLLRRDAPFHQSGGHIYMHRRGGVGVGLALQDFFHVALSMPILILFTGCLTLYTLVILLWAGLYSVLDHPEVQCGIAPFGEHPQFYHAFFFSLETMATIGYDIPHGDDLSAFLTDGCMPLFIAVFFQVQNEREGGRGREREGGSRRHPSPRQWPL